MVSGSAQKTFILEPPDWRLAREAIAQDVKKTGQADDDHRRSGRAGSHDVQVFVRGRALVGVFQLKSNSSESAGVLGATSSGNGSRAVSLTRASG